MTLTQPKAQQRTYRAARDRSTSDSNSALASIVGDAPPIVRARRLAERAGRSESPSLIIGESGTGKELFAKAMHDISQRANYPFIPVNCAAIPESLIESELFGYEHGAFTGADKQGRASLFERAHRGTLFLDELADLSLHAQAALLRVLEEGAVTRVGGSRAIVTDVRVIGAANKPFEDLISQREFRRDLYHRLCVIPLCIPPLRERRQDILVLAKHFLAALGDSRRLSGEVLDYLLDYHWPGNIRELQNCLKYMTTMADGPFSVNDLPPHIQPRVQIDGSRAASREPLFSAAAPLADATLPPENLYSSLLDEHCSIILAMIEDAHHTGRHIGRRSLRVTLHQAGLFLSERAVRRRLRALQADGLVNWGRGRTGVQLTLKGLSVRQQTRSHSS